MTIRVLITCVGGTMMPCLLSELKSDSSLSLHLIGVDSDKNAIGKKYLDKFFTVPSGVDPSYISAVYAIAEEESVDVIVVLSDEEAFKLAKKKHEFEKINVNVLVSPIEVLKLIEDKVLTYKILKKNGIRIPKYKSVKNIRELKKEISYYGYPTKSVIIKPVFGRGGRGVKLLSGSILPPDWVATGKRESRLTRFPSNRSLKSFFNYGDLMVMPLLQKPVYDVDVFAIKGRVEHIIVRERHNPVGIPFKGSNINTDEEIYDYCTKISEALGLDGLHDIDLMTGDDGTVCVLEVNPRPSGSVVASHKAVFPIMLASIAKLIDKTYVMPSRPTIMI